MLLRNAARLNGLTGLAITKLDVLGGLEEIKICDSYQCNGKHLTDFPTDLKVLETCQPVLETLPGWSEDISGIRQYDELPKNTQAYIQRIQELVEVPVDLVSIGPGRDQTIVLRNPFAGQGD